MIEYEPGRLAVGFIFRIKGSVFPKALIWSTPAAALSYVLHHFVEHTPSMSISQVWSAYNFILGFLVVFRTQQAYSRFWEGATILQQVRGEWFNAVSSCFAFCSSNPEKAAEVNKFQHLLIRLASLLYCTALQQIAVLSDEAFEILDLEGLDKGSLDYLGRAPEKCLVILQWIQRLIVQGTENGVLSVSPPILSRVYQEFSRGIVNVVNAQKITDIIFPFPYAQMVTVMLIMTTIVTPYVMAVLVKEVFWGTLLTFVSVTAYWCMNYIAAEIEMPFGEDDNDLPIAHLQVGLNTALRMLLDESSRNPPKYHFDEIRDAACEPVKCPFHLVTDVQHKIWGSAQHKLRKAQRINKIKRESDERRRSLERSSERPSQSFASSWLRGSTKQSLPDSFRQSEVNVRASQEQFVLSVSDHSEADDKVGSPEAPKLSVSGSDGDLSPEAPKLSVSESDGDLQVLAPQSKFASPSAVGKAMPARSDEWKTPVDSQEQGAQSSLPAASSSHAGALPASTDAYKACKTLLERSKFDMASEFSSHELLLDSRLAGTIARMQAHFLRISEDLSFITSHSSWPRELADVRGLPRTGPISEIGERAEVRGSPSVEVANFSASIELHCSAIARALGDLAVALCKREVEGVQMSVGPKDNANIFQPNFSAFTKSHLPL